MIQSIVINRKRIQFLCDNQSNKVAIDLSNIIEDKINSFDIEITFSKPITAFRNHDYTWIKPNHGCNVNEFLPKIIQLSNGSFIQPNSFMGIWEIDKKKPNILLWRFNPLNSKPLTIYKGEKNQKTIAQATSKYHHIENVALLITNKPIEFSRSKIPFSAIAVFTDHCDFDTANNLKLQREFFKKNGIITTKGFFLNHFSKREDNASFKNEEQELIKWKEDGHELCYHSLSQSIKSEEESYNDFFSFQPPFHNTTTWIDHGYQPYNFSLFQNNAIDYNDYENALSQKNIRILWNYIDSGTATLGVLNQLNPSHFTLLSFLNGTKDLSFIKRLQLMLKNIIFHYYGDEELILKYKNTASNFKKFITHKQLSYFFSFVKDIFSISFKLIAVFLNWRTSRNKPYNLAKYTPILFKHTIAQKEFYVFQTIEMLDFKKALHPKNIDSLIKEKGVFMAHTYFSVPMDYHQGKLFSDENTIDVQVAQNFESLGKKIKNNEIWNPTLQELVAYWSNFENLVLDIDSQGVIFVKNKTDLLFRTVI
ncbi:MAG: hypothetical protein WCJ62_00795 [Flavobacterium sp.]